jgi:hypothetical protein
MSLKIKLHEQKIVEFRVHEMANKWQEETGLPMNIWLDESQTYLRGGHSKRLKFQLDTSDRLNPDNVGSMDLDGNIHPKNLKIHGLKSRELTKLKNFVHNNRYALDRLADMEIRLYKVWPYVIKGGELATDAQIAALNAKVDELVSQQSKK